MFSAPSLLIATGLIFLAVCCSIFPVAPTSRVAILMLIGSTLCFFVPEYIGFTIAFIIVVLTIQDAILASRKAHLIRTMPDQLARGIPSPFRIGRAPKNYGSKFTKIRIRQPRCADIELSQKEATNDLAGTITALRRGHHVIPPFSTRIKGPLGLAVWHKPYQETHDVKVFPDLPAANRLAHSIQQGRYATAGLKRRGPLGLGTNFESVREYFPDDDMRLVNWSATARTGKPMTNQYRVEQDRDVFCLIDTGRLMTAPLPVDLETNNKEIDLLEEDEPLNYCLSRLDIALDSACGVVSVADIMGDRAGVITFDSKVRKHLKPRRAGARSVIKTIYDLEPIPVDSDFEAACQRIGRSKRSFVLIMTDFLDLQSAQPLLRALRTIVRKHRVVVSSVIDPDIKNASNRYSIGDSKYVDLAAEEMSASIQEVIAAIKNAGAEVVYAEHDKNMLECVKTYLQAKQRAAI